MDDANAPSRDVLWKMYQEHCTQGRHHETQRSTVISVVMAISAVVIGIISFDKSIAAPSDVPLSLFLVVLGVFGAGFSMKHYERFEFHMERARQHRSELDDLLPQKVLSRLKREADSVHKKRYPHMHRWRLHYWWVALNLIVTFVGVGLLLIAIWFPIKVLN